MMLRTLNRILQDIKQGENIDLYVTVLVALVLATLNILGVVPQSAVAPITLAVLGLIAVVLLGNRYRIDELLSRAQQNDSSFFAEEFPQSLKSDFEKAPEVWLVGVSLSRTIKTNYNLIEKKLQGGHKIRALVVHPEGMGIEVAVNRNYGRRVVEEKSRDIRTSLDNLCDIRRNTKGKIEIRTTNHPLTYGGYVINPGSDLGILYLENYQYRLATESLPRFVLRATDGKWYDFYRKELSKIWDDADDWTCDT